jgi:clan AA aspartic protease (TIGR02281 family)
MSRCAPSHASWLAVIACLFLAQGAWADGYFDQGVRLYNRRDFKGAASYFEVARRNNSSDSNAIYYLALTYQQLGDWARAKQQYRDLAQRFPNSQAAGYALQYLRAYDPDFVRHLDGGGGSSSGSSPSSRGVSSYGGGGEERAADYDQLPQTGRIDFKRVRNSQYVEGSVNGHSIEMVFDTGAEMTVFGKNHLRDLGVPLPTGAPTGLASGVGSDVPLGVWTTRVDLQVGNIRRRNFPITVQDRLDDPLLGQTFFKEYQFTTDPNSNCINLRKKGFSVAAAGDANSVPFTKEGNELVVTALVNGKPCQMFFDTGADSIAFSPSHLKRLGITIPDDAEMGTSTGIGGTTNTASFRVDSIKLGPIQRDDVNVSVVEASNMGKPLLGQSFYKDWQFTIDNDRHFIHFSR